MELCFWIYVGTLYSVYISHQGLVPNSSLIPIKKINKKNPIFERIQFVYPLVHQFYGHILEGSLGLLL